MKRIFFLSILFIFCVIAASGVALAEKRVALVIGNSAYAFAPLPNPRNDAKLMARTLKDLGFEVIETLDASHREMKVAIRSFGKKLDAAGKDGVGLFFYAGHGVQVKGANYIIPVDAAIETEGDVDIEAINTQSVMSMMEYSGARLSFVILDACRNNPFKRSFRSATRGLAKMDAPTGSLIAYATGPGDVAADGDGANSPYTKALSRMMKQPGMPVERMFREVRNSVRNETGNQQTPWESSSLVGGDFFFKPGNTPTVQTTTGVPIPTPAIPAPGQSAEMMFWSNIQNSGKAVMFEAYLEQYPNGAFAPLARARVQELKEPASNKIVSLQTTSNQIKIPPSSTSLPPMVAKLRKRPKTGTFKNVIRKGYISCGVSTGVHGFSATDQRGVWSGLDVDYCRAIATAIFNDAEKVRFTPLSAKVRFTALQSGEVDILARHSSWTMSRDTRLGLDFVGPNFIDGQAIMVRRSLGVRSATELDGASACMMSGTTTQLNLENYFQAHDMMLAPVIFDTWSEITRGFVAGRCDILSTDGSGLAAMREGMQNPENYIILPERLTLEPLSPMVRQGDDMWRSFVQTVFDGLLLAEEKGITQRNIAINKAYPLIAASRKIGIALGLRPEWLSNVIKQVGNYEDIYTRHFGPDGVHIPRGLNTLVRNGGLLIANRFGEIQLSEIPVSSGSPSIKSIRSHGQLRCGIVNNPDAALVSKFNAETASQSFDQETCGAVSSALFGRSNATKIFYGRLENLLRDLAVGNIHMIASPVTRDTFLGLSGYVQPVVSLVDLVDDQVIPKGPVIGGGNNQFNNLVRWSILARTVQDEIGGNRILQNIIKKRSATLGRDLGLSETWYGNILSSVGSLEESLRDKTASNSTLARLNASWGNGGAQFAPPLR